MDNTEYDGSDRRINIHLRGVFEAACRVTAPFFDPNQEWAGGASHTSHTMYARQALRDTFPALTQQDIALLLAAVRRHHSGTHNS